MNGDARPAQLETLKTTIHARFLEQTNLGALGRLSGEALAEQVGALTRDTLAREGIAFSRRQSDSLADAVLSEIVGLGPLEPLLRDPSVTEILVNGPGQVYIERAGRLVKADIRFDDDAHVLRIIERIVAPLGRRIDETSPLVDARLPDGSRVNAIIPPLAITGPTLAIRKFAVRPYSMEDLVRLGALTESMCGFLWACIVGRLNMLISGGTGSGKTTALNALSAFIPPGERIITIEDAAELQVQQAHVVALESRPANLEGRGEITIRHLVRNALRMRPDRILIGEVRGGEALDLLMAMNTGHDGSLSTAHANSPRDALARLETMVLMAGADLPIRAIREQIASALHLVIHQSRLRDGRRVFTHISEVQGMEGDAIRLEDIFRFDQQGIGEDGQVLGAFRATGLRPRCLEALHAQGVSLAPEVFQS